MADGEMLRDRLGLQDNREILSPPIVKSPLYACATAVIVLGFVAHAELELEIGGSTLPRKQAGSPDPDGFIFTGLAVLSAPQIVRARQFVDGIPSNWSQPVTVRNYTADFPAGPPRPEINPAPVYECGSRTGVSNLLIGCNVWIEADGTEVGRVNGAKDHQGVNVNPDYSLNERVRAYAEMCGDRTPPSEEFITQSPPAPLPVPVLDPAYEDGEVIRITNLVNGASFHVDRGGVTIGPIRTWGWAHLVSLNPPFSAGETITVRQQMCASDPPSDPGSTTVRPCADLPAPIVEPIQIGDTQIRLIEYVPGARIKVFANTTKIGDGGGAVIALVRPVQDGETIYVYQVLGPCEGRNVRVVEPKCVAPPVTVNPAALNLFPVGFADYATGDFKGSVYYPAEDDGQGRPFNRSLAEIRRAPIVFIAHGNHPTRYNPDDRMEENSPNCDPPSPASWREIPNHKGYSYFQRQLARMGIIAVSVDCNETNGCTWNTVQNIERRAELIMGSIGHFQALDRGGDAIFGNHIDFSRVGLMGHSRGGEAVVIAGNQSPGLLGVTVRAVIALAPVNHGLFLPQDYAFMTILPANDGDVSENGGARFYDKAVPRPLKSQLYIDFANHNFFNREWVRDEKGRLPPVILSRWECERILSAYGCAMYRSFLLDHATTGYLTYRVRPPGINTGNIHLSFEWIGQVTVDDHEQGNLITVNSLNHPTSQSGGLAANEYGLQQAGMSPYVPNTFFGETVGMVVEGLRLGVFRSELDREYDLSDPRFEIWLRAAEVSNGGPNASTGPVFRVGLEDQSGNRAWTDINQVGLLPRPFDQSPLSTKSILTTLRVPASCFRPEQRENFRNNAVSAILIEYDGKGVRPVAFDVLQIVREP
jgi:hypothetical protein